jgi:pimeloyl-ACP methyl ester carboxylesterase
VLLRFAGALSASGAAVLIPEIPEWKELRVSPESVPPIINAAITDLNEREETRSGHMGLVGFSFGAPQAIIAAADPTLTGRLSLVLGYGGYCEPEPTVRFLFTGEHEWKGRRFRLPPDPYGRWVIGANYLTSVPGYEDAHDVAQALWKLAAEAGERRVLAWDPEYDPVKDAVVEEVSPERREIFRLFAPSSEMQPDPGRVEPLIKGLTAAFVASSPLSTPTPFLSDVRTPVHLFHGREDHLIPFSETLRLAERFGNHARVHASVTGLFGHSYRHRALSLAHQALEAGRFFMALRKVMAGL